MTETDHSDNLMLPFIVSQASGKVSEEEALLANYAAHMQIGKNAAAPLIATRKKQSSERLGHFICALPLSL
jgi:hypothetical protein